MSPDRAVPTFGRPRDTQSFGVPATAALRAQLLEARAAAGASGLWVLECRLGDDGSLQRTPVQPVPFRVGRSAGLQLVLPSAHVSKLHAEIYTDGLALRVRDLGSRNGTFLNREKVADAALHEGDVLHFGDYEFRVTRDLPEPDVADDDGTLVRTAPLSRHFVSGAEAVRRLIDERAVTMLFQPLVTLPSGRVSAYEALGRGRLAGLPGPQRGGHQDAQGHRLHLPIPKALCQDQGPLRGELRFLQLPFLQAALGDFKLVPIGMGDQSRAGCGALRADARSTTAPCRVGSSRH